MDIVVALITLPTCEFDASQLARSSWSCAVLIIIDKPLRASIASSSRPPISRKYISDTEFANIAWSFSKL